MIAQIHHEKTDVAHDVDPAHRRVELDAVEQRRPAVDERDVAQVKVAVALADEALPVPPLERRREPRGLGVRPGVELFELRAVPGVFDGPLHLDEVLADRAHDARGAAERRLGRGAGGLAVKRRDCGGDLVHVRGRELAARQHPRQQAVLVELPHLHRVFDRRALASEHGCVQRTRDRNDVQVKRRREPAVEAELLAAIELASRQGGEIEEVEVDGLLDLVREGPVEQHERDVCLDHLQAGRRHQAPLVGKGHGSPHGFQLCSVRM